MGVIWVLWSPLALSVEPDAPGEHSIESPVSLIDPDTSGTDTVGPTSPQDQFMAAVAVLRDKNFRVKGEAIVALEASNHARTRELLEAMLGSRLFYQKSNQRVVIVTPSGDEYAIVDAISGGALGVVGKRSLKKISVNNQLRKSLRGVLARMSLESTDADIRLDAVKEIVKNVTPEVVTLLRAVLAKEEDDKVREMIDTVLVLVDVDSTDKATRIAAIEKLAGSLDTNVRNRLAEIVQQQPDGSYVETDADIRYAADRILQRIESRLQFYRIVETLFFGLSLGSVLALAAIGLAITFGVMGVINMAHGELIMLGAYTTYVVQLWMPQHIDLSLFVAIPAAFLVSGLFGIAIERGVIRFLYGRPLETLLATFGVSLILQQLVRSIFSPLNRSVSTPSWMSGSLEINSALSLTYNRLYIVIFTLLVFMALFVIMKKTSLGLKVRAVSQNRAMAKAMGVRSEWVDTMAFGLGAGIAGVAGVALSQLTNVGPNLGQAYIVDSFMVVVFGGVGNLWGTLIGGFTLGLVNKVIEPFAGAVLAKIMVLVFIILFIQKHPRGLFPQKGRAAEN